MSVNAHWGYLPPPPKKAPTTKPPAQDDGLSLQDLAQPKLSPKRKPKPSGKPKIPDARVLAIFRSKEDMTPAQAAKHFNVHVSTVNSIRRKAVRHDLLRNES